MIEADGTSLTLLRRARSGDARAWEQLVALYSPLVAHWVRRWGLQPADVEDVCQEAFAAVAGRLERFRKERPHDTFRGWLRGVVRNKLLEFARRDNARPPAVGGTEALAGLMQQPQPIRDDDTDADGEPLSRVIAVALDGIRDEFRPATWRAFWQAAVERRAVADIASDLGLSANAVRVARCRVLRRLREQLGDLDIDEIAAS